MQLSFYDHHRQSYAHLELQGNHVAEFMVGNYSEDGGVGPPGEFKIQLHDFSQRWRDRGLSPQICAFGDGIGSARLLLALADAHDVELLADTPDRDAFSERLLALGLHDHSDKPLNPSLQEAGS